MNRFLKLFKPQRGLAADVRNITHFDTPLGQEVLTIYERSFPEAERDPVENIAASLNNSDLSTEVTHLRALVEQGVAARPERTASPRRHQHAADERRDARRLSNGPRRAVA